MNSNAKLYRAIVFLFLGFLSLPTSVFAEDTDFGVAFGKSVSPKTQTLRESDAEPGRSFDELSIDVRRQTFNLVWKKISENFYDPTYKGVNWNAVREKYSPEVEKTADVGGFHALLNRMVKEIKESHLSVIPPPKIKDAQHSVSQASIGVELAWIENQILITAIEPESSASQANLQVGESIVSVDNISVNDIFRQFLSSWLMDSAELREQQRAISVARKLYGLPGSIIKLNLRDRRNNSREVTVAREISTTHGAVQPVAFRKLEPNIGYIRIPIWAGKLGDQLDKAFQEFADCSSIVIDLRGNIGGVAAQVAGLAGRISERDGNLGEFHYRYKKESFAFKGSGEKAYKGKIIVLIDEKSASSSEVFAGGLQDLGRITVVGKRSGGAVLLSLIEPLPSGGSMLYPIADFYTPKGTRIEGRGVKPDVEVKITRRSIIENRDLIMEKAMAIARDKRV